MEQIHLVKGGEFIAALASAFLENTFAVNVSITPDLDLPDGDDYQVTVSHPFHSMIHQHLT